MAYLIDHPPVRDQFRSRGTKKPTGCTVIHTAESILDTVGPDTGAEGVARFIQSRTTAGSYHDIADSDSAIHLVPYHLAAYQDGTGSNPWAMSISFALAAADWPKLGAARRDAFLGQAAIAFRRQQVWLQSKGYPTTPLRRITKVQSDAGVAGFISHGERDPGRRSDPGASFPWDRFFELLSSTPSPTKEDDDMRYLRDINHGRLGVVGPGFFLHFHTIEEVNAYHAAGLIPAEPDEVSGGEWDLIESSTRRAFLVAPGERAVAEDTQVKANAAWVAAEAARRELAAGFAEMKAVDVDALAAALLPGLTAALGDQLGLTEADVEAALRRVLGSLDTTGGS